MREMATNQAFLGLQMEQGGKTKLLCTRVPQSETPRGFTVRFPAMKNIPLPKGLGMRVVDVVQRSCLWSQKTQIQPPRYDVFFFSFECLNVLGFYFPICKMLIIPCTLQGYHLYGGYFQELGWCLVHDLIQAFYNSKRQVLLLF